MCFWFRKATPAESSRNNPSDPIQEGDLHSGPSGYSPNIAYPETQYGSRFDEDAAWNEEEN
jgi:hypothetical protein